MSNPLYAPVPDEDEDFPAPSCGAYLGILFAVIFEAVIGVSVILCIAGYHFLRGWILGR